MSEAKFLPKHLLSLQYLRAIAALSVVYFHAVVQVEHVGGSHTYPKFGASGVDVFFVLSGFVMWMTTSGRKGQARDFLKRRLVRIAPLYWIVTVAAALFALTVPHLLKSTAFGASHVAASLAFLPWWNPAAPLGSQETFFPIIVPGWTLNLEMVFYALFALCLHFEAKVRPVLLALLLLSLFALGRNEAVVTSPLSFYGNSRIFEFLGGVFIAAYLVPRLRVALRSAIALCLVAWLGMLVTEALGSELPTLVKFGLPAMVIVATSIGAERAVTMPRIGWLESLGDASYSIYLTHVFVMPAVRLALQFAGVQLTGMVATAFVPFAVVLSGLVGWAVHRIIEAPIVAIANEALRGDRPPPNQAMLR